MRKVSPVAKNTGQEVMPCTAVSADCRGPSMRGPPPAASGKRQEPQPTDAPWGWEQGAGGGFRAFQLRGPENLDTKPFAAS